MEIIWFGIVAFMLAAYVVLDGFDIGIGILFPFLSRSEEDRRMMIRTIGPVWDGNEVWLIAGGGTLFFAFPLLYASSFSGFYLPLIIVLWLLIGRGASIELRTHIDSSVWRSFFTGLFFASSALLAIFLGAALANVIRGVPLGPDHYFFLPLWTTWRVSPNPGILDWYTVTGGLVALVALAVHGGLYLALKVTGDLEARAIVFIMRSWFALCLITVVSLVGTIVVRPSTLEHYREHPGSFLIPVLVGLSLVAIRWFTKRGHQLKAFLSSSLYLICMLVGAAIGLYPTVLPSSTTPLDDLTVANTISSPYATHVGLIWWIFGIILALGYFFVTYGMFRGKVSMSDSGYDH